MNDTSQGAVSRAEAPPRKPRRRGRVPQPAHVLAVAGAMLRERRERLGFTLEYVAERARVTFQYLSEIERGCKAPSADVLGDLIGVLALPAADVFCAFRVVPEAAAERFFDPDRMREALARKGGA